ncbi:MAG: hypothetical protein QME89_06465 [Actinomycetota bacterium]|nr:hypothetical protein [Actinomycetota bacterium]
MFRLTERVVPREGLPEKGACDAVVEVAGRDSVGAAVALARMGRIRRVLPSVAFTGTEFGDLDSPTRNVQLMRRLLEPEGVVVEDPVVVGSPPWWRATVGRVNTVLSRRYGPWHICLGCHMYLHALRIPLCRRLGIGKLVAGERLGHAGREKVNQGHDAVSAYRRVVESFGIRFELPLLEVDDEEEMISLVGGWREGENQPSCVLSGNYQDQNGEVLVERERVRAYLDEYLVPVTVRIVSEILERGKADYQALVWEILEG